MSNRQKKILMTTPMTRHAKHAKEAGFYLVALMNKATNLCRISQYADELYVFDINNEERLKDTINNLHKHHNFDHIYHIGHDNLMETAYSIAESYNLSLNPLNSIKIMNDKYKMRELLEKNNISTIRYKSFDTLMDVYNHAEDFKYPFILKPTNLSGSIGVFLCKSANDIIEWIEIMKKANYSGPFLMEEYLEGPEVSVECISNNAQHEIIGITDKIKTTAPLFVELGHIHPSSQDEDIQSEIKNLVIKYLDLINYQFGPSHTELIITKNGPKIVESHARFGGDRIPDLVEAASGICMESMIFNSLYSKPLSLTNKGKVAMISYFQWDKGKKIKEIIGLDDVSELPYVLMIENRLQPGDDVPDISNSYNRYGYIAVEGNSHKDAINKMEIAMNLIKVRYNKELAYEHE